MAPNQSYLPLHACPLGALDIALPLLSAGELIGYLVTAQIQASGPGLPGNASPDPTAAEADECAALLARLPSMPRAEFQSIADSLHTVARLIAVLVDARRRNLRLAERLREQAKLTQQQSLTDAETGLANRRRFSHALQAEIARARRYRRNLSVAALDLLGLRRISDEFGYDVCKQVLRAVALSLVSNLRETDLAARVADSHLAVLLPETARHEAMIPLARVKGDIEDLNASGELPVEVRVSMGVADEIAECDEMLRAAFDRARRERSAANVLP